MKVVFHRDFYNVYTGDPAAARGRMEAIVEAISPVATFLPPVPAEKQDLCAVHSESHIERVRKQGLYRIAALAAGAAIQTAEIGLSEPCFGLIRPPGHHASSGSAWGFCYFNNMAVALTALRRKGSIRTAYVLDIDLHFGDGTVDILGGQDWVRVHNVEAFSRRDFLQQVEGAMKDMQADLIGISAGFDTHVADWGGILETQDYETIGEWVRSAACRSGGGCFALLEGGYNHHVLGENVLALISGLSGGKDP